MHTVLEILEKTRRFLDRKGIDNSRLNSELILSHTLDCSRLDLYLQFDRLLKESELDLMRPLVLRRSKHEPIQYILGKVDFFNVSLKVDDRVLIPRPETEQLLLTVTETLLRPPRSILDLGAGAGAIAIALASHYPGAMVTAVDCDKDALELVAENVTSVGLQDRIIVLASDWYEAVDSRFDLVIANPPYLSKDDWISSDPEVREFEPVSALVAEREGLADLREILGGAPQYLNAEGLIALETGIDQHDALATIAAEIGFERWESRKDLNKHDRFFFAWI